MDLPRTGVRTLSGLVDLHLHSTASDGVIAPAEVVRRADRLGLEAIALTDHDTTAGLEEAVAEGERIGVRVVSGCEFSVLAAWGEMHLLGYFVPHGPSPVEAFLERARGGRLARAEQIVAKLVAWGVDIRLEDVLEESGDAAVGRPHVARALVRLGKVPDMQAAFDEFLATGRRAYVEKVLPPFAEVADLVHRVGGVVSAAHLRERGTRGVLEVLVAEGLDAVEARHPSHSPDMVARIVKTAETLGILTTGGSDWHGDDSPASHGILGSQRVPMAWLEALEAARPPADASGAVEPRRSA